MDNLKLVEFWRFSCSSAFYEILWLTGKWYWFYSSNWLILGAIFHEILLSIGKSSGPKISNCNIFFVQWHSFSKSADTPSEFLSQCHMQKWPLTLLSPWLIWLIFCLILGHQEYNSATAQFLLKSLIQRFRGGLGVKLSIFQHYVRNWSLIFDFSFNLSCWQDFCFI